MTEHVDPNPEPGTDLARRARELVYGQPRADEEPPFVEAEVIDDDRPGQASPPAGGVKFMNVFHGGAPKRVIQVNGTLNISSLDDL